MLSQPAIQSLLSRSFLILKGDGHLAATGLLMLRITTLIWQKTKGFKDFGLSLAVAEREALAFCLQLISDQVLRGKEELRFFVLGQPLIQELFLGQFYDDLTSAPGLLTYCKSFPSHPSLSLFFFLNVSKILQIYAIFWFRWDPKKPHLLPPGLSKKSAKHS